MIEQRIKKIVIKISGFFSQILFFLSLLYSGYIVYTFIVLNSGTSIEKANSNELLMAFLSYGIAILISLMFGFVCLGYYFLVSDFYSKNKS